MKGIEDEKMMNVKHDNNKINIDKYLISQSLKKQNECVHDWNEVRVWSFGATYIKYCNKCNAKETYTKA